MALTRRTKSVLTILNFLQNQIMNILVYPKQIDNILLVIQKYTDNILVVNMKQGFSHPSQILVPCSAAVVRA